MVGLFGCFSYAKCIPTYIASNVNERHKEEKNTTNLQAFISNKQKHIESISWILVRNACTWKYTQINQINVDTTIQTNCEYSKNKQKKNIVEWNSCRMENIADSLYAPDTKHWAKNEEEKSDLVLFCMDKLLDWRLNEQTARINAIHLRQGTVNQIGQFLRLPVNWARSEGSEMKEIGKVDKRVCLTLKQNSSSSN